MGRTLQRKMGSCHCRLRCRRWYLHDVSRWVPRPLQLPFPLCIMRLGQYTWKGRFDGTMTSELLCKQSIIHNIRQSIKHMEFINSKFYKTGLSLYTIENVPTPTKHTAWCSINVENWVERTVDVICHRLQRTMGVREGRWSLQSPEPWCWDLEGLGDVVLEAKIEQTNDVLTS